MKRQLDTHNRPLGYELQLTRNKKHVMSSHLVQVMEMTGYISDDREEIKKQDTSKGWKHIMLMFLFHHVELFYMFKSIN